MKNTQMIRSVLALALFGAFIVTGRMYVWKTPGELPSDPVPVTTGTGTVPAVIPLTETSTTALSTSTETTTASSASSVTVTTIALTTASGAQAAVSSTLSTSATSATTLSTSATASTSAQATSSLTSSQTEAETTAAQEPVPNPVPGMVRAPEGYFNDALFIGDSRTVGQAYYGPIDGAVYFASTGMSTANIGGAVSEVSATQGMNFSSAISARQYGKVYVMLGINELGNDYAATMQNFRNLIAQIQSAQPGAIIYIEANLHVTAARSAQNVYGVNNEMINRFNAEFQSMADNKTVYYLDVNPLFDDASGALAEEYTRDGVHPIATNYPTWADWLKANVVVK